MARLIWTEPALLDLEEIAEYIALDKPSAAKKLVRGLWGHDKAKGIMKISSISIRI